MDWVDINERKGMPFGGMPHDTILRKLEETDSNYTEDGYFNYAIGEILDRASDTPYLESDQIRREPSISRGVLNIRYNGTRGSQYELPIHPELFVGFTDKDPRGTETQPRFDLLRSHTEARAKQHIIRMGNNDDNHEAERPWTGSSFEDARMEILRRTRNNVKIFSTERDGQMAGFNFVTKESSNRRLGQINNGNEGVPLVMTKKNTIHQSTFGNNISPWHGSTGDTNLSVEYYGKNKNDAVKFGDLTNMQENQQNFGNSDTRFNQLAKSMSIAANKFQIHQINFANTNTGRISKYKIGGDIAAAYYSTQHIQQPHIDDKNYVNGGVIPSTEQLHFVGQPTHTNTPINQINIMVHAMHETSASERQRARFAIVASGNRPTNNTEMQMQNGSMIPSANSIAQYGKPQLIRAAAAQDLKIQNYSSVAPINRGGQAPTQYGLLPFERKGLPPSYIVPSNYGGMPPAEYAYLPSEDKSIHFTPNQRMDYRENDNVLIGATPDETFGFDPQPLNSNAMNMGSKNVRVDRFDDKDFSGPQMLSVGA
jgi:hypothetical protein